jgi:anthranilate phosphoribosyltransferase
MAITHYLKEIGRGKRGARPLDRAQSADLFGQVLDGTVTDLEVGAFCLAMRVKGETAEEMAGFLDATYQRLNRLPASDEPLVVLPSYNGARKLPVLTPLLALLVAREGLPVLMHGTATESSRVCVPDVLAALAIPHLSAIRKIAPGEAVHAPTELLSASLKRLLDVRRVVGLRNPAHSLVKLMNPCAGRAVIVSSYTHQEYALSMAAVFALMESTALLLRGTEGEVVADARRLPEMDGYVRGKHVALQAAEKGTNKEVPGLPRDTSAENTAAYIREVMAGSLPVPPAIAQQVEHILRLARQS